MVLWKTVQKWCSLESQKWTYPSAIWWLSGTASETKNQVSSKCNSNSLQAVNPARKNVLNGRL